MQIQGSINRRQPLHDVIFDYKQPAGPFQSVKSFYDWIANLTRRMPLDEDKVVDPMRSGLLDDSIVFTHGDLHRSNILLSKSHKGPPYIVAVIDWHQSAVILLRGSFSRLASHAGGRNVGKTSTSSSSCSHTQETSAGSTLYITLAFETQGCF